MTKREQRGFVTELLNSIRRTIVSQIQENKIPQDWDGYELRELIADKANSARSHVMQIRGNQRKRNYNNHVLVNNL